MLKLYSGLCILQGIKTLAFSGLFFSTNPCLESQPPCMGAPKNLKTSELPCHTRRKVGMLDFYKLAIFCLLFWDNIVYLKVYGGQIMTIERKRVKSSIGQKEVFENPFETLGRDLKQNEKLAPHTTLGIGGEANFFYIARKPQDLIKVIQVAKESKIPFFVLGGGSNVLVNDSGFKGLVIKNRCKQIFLNDNQITCQSGALLDDLVGLSCENSLSGLEFAAGIPGTVGGAVYGNAGAFGKTVGDLLTEAVILNSRGNIERVEKGYFEFGYRESKLKKTKEILLSATFELKKKEKGEIKKEVQSNLEERRKRHPQKEKSAGCFFKNVSADGKKIPAGFLLEQVSAKEMREGDAAVFQRHANILINSGKAKAEDVRRLANLLKRKVKEKFDVDLEEEVVYLS
jgi:UDP-N-acetylmuramate dehydrogenase